MRIRVDTDRLRDLAVQLGRAADQFTTLREKVLRAWYSLSDAEFQTRYRGQIAPSVQQVQRVGGQVATSCRDGQRRLQNFAQTMETTDRELAMQCAAIQASFVERVGIGAVAGAGAVASSTATVLRDAGYLTSEVGRRLDYLTDIGLMTTDDAIGTFFDQQLPFPAEGGSESTEFQVTAGVTIAGVYVEPGQTVRITRNDDGTYTVSVGGELEAGLKAAAEAKGRVKFMGKKYGVGIDAEEHAGLKTEGEYQFKYDPAAPGDMTKMGVLLASLGMATIPGLNAVSWMGPAVSAGNLNSVSGATGIVTGGGIDVSAAVPVVSASYSADMMLGSEVRKNDLRQTEIAISYSTSLESEASVFVLEDGSSVESTITRIYNQDTGVWSTEITQTIQSQIGGTVDIEGAKRKGLLPKGTSVSGGLERYSNIEVTYRVDDDPENVMQQINPDGKGIRVSNIPEEATLEVTGTTGTTFDVGFEVGLGLKVSAEAEAGASVTRESTVQLYKSSESPVSAEAHGPGSASVSGGGGGGTVG